MGHRSGAAGHNGYHNEIKVNAPGIVVGRSGGSFGQVHFCEKGFWPHNTAMFVTDFKGNDPYFVFYLLKLLNFDSLNSGSAQPSLNRNYLYPVKAMVPDPSEQKRVVNVIRKIDQKIALNNQINAELEAMAKLIYDYWFVQFDFPDADGKPYKSSGGKMVWSEELKRDIPEGWEPRELCQIANITMGQSPAGTSYNADAVGKLFYQGSTDFGWLFPTARQYTTEPSRLAKKGDILLSVRAPVGDMNIANADCCIGRGLAALNSYQGFDGYLFYVMKYFKQVFDRRNSQGTTFGSITKDDLHTLKVAYPSLQVLTDFESLVSPMNKMIFTRSSENQELAYLRDWLLPMLMNGQVTVATPKNTG